MTCTMTCVEPSPSQAHCGACHITFGGISGFDRHRRDGQCLPPDAIGYTDNGRGVYRAPMTEAGRQRLASLQAAQAAEQPEPVGQPTPEPPNGSEGDSGGPTEVWISNPPPGGYVCAAPDPRRPDGICGMPVESEPCNIHAPS